jgi:hypothetical protein
MDISRSTIISFREIITLDEGETDFFNFLGKTGFKREKRKDHPLVLQWWIPFELHCLSHLRINAF